ncbi:helix-turn-helix domain-containing protein [Paenibacillus macerans]|uniref:helix-turn-helix domain-containing protein n=1 Tax=Paenibacillus macerans TaxID=44252 RepID=UPI00203C939E|nr:helix-turn-helix domain-containing protein [Paenibacillus macerans]MCM3701513.1 helix-turn-helix domain-containing protein [Paenibacillus macerans]
MRYCDNQRLYSPRQPHFEQKFYTHSYIVDEHDKLLYGKVLEIYQYKSDVLEDTIMVLPDGCFELMFSFYDDHIESHLVIGESEVVQMNVNECRRMFGFCVRLLPGWLGQIYTAPLKNKTDDIRYSVKYINSFEVMEGFDRFYRKIVSTNSFEDRIEVCRRYFGSMKESSDNQSELAKHGCLFLLKGEGNSSINELEKYLGYSSRYIRMIFDDYVGFSPKKFNEIIRFQSSFSHYYSNPSISLSELACNFGYYDLSHMNRSYLKLAKNLPKALFRKLSTE